MEGVREFRFHDSPHGFRCLQTRPGFHGPGGRHFHSDTQERMGRRSRRGPGAKRRRFCQHSGEDPPDRQSPRSASVRSAGEWTAPQRRTVFPRGASHQVGRVVDRKISREVRLVFSLSTGSVAKANVMAVVLKNRLWTLMFLVSALGTGWSQSNGWESPANSGGQASGGQASNGQGSIPQTDLGQDSVTQSVEAPTISGLDQSSIDPTQAPSRSCLLAGIHVSEGAESDPSWMQGFSSQTASVTNLLGSFSLLKSRRNSETAIDYMGGDTVYSEYAGERPHNQQFEKLNADERILWSKGQLAFRDSFYTGDGDFGSSSFGGVGAYNSTGVGAGIPANTGVSDFFGASQFGEVSQAAYVTNASVVDATQALTPRSSVYVAGDYSLTDYLSDTESLFNSRQISAQAGYDHQLSRPAEIEAVYGYQVFKFPESGVGKLVANSVQLAYQRLSYNRLVSAGSGFFAGGISQIALLSLSRNITRSWRTILDGGYTKVSGIGLSASGTPATSYEYGYAGAAIQRQLGRSVTAFASYQFNNENFGGCGATQNCIPPLHPQIVLIGFDWYIRPVRLD